MPNAPRWQAGTHNFNNSDYVCDPSALDNDSCDSAIRASFLHFKSDPDLSGDSFEYFEDGLLILKQGRVRAAGRMRSTGSINYPTVRRSTITAVAW